MYGPPLRRGSYPCRKEILNTEHCRRVMDECNAMRVDRRLNATGGMDVLSNLFILRGVPGHISSDNGPKFIAKALRDWIVSVGAKKGPTSCRALHGEIAIARASNRGSVTSHLTVKSSTPSRKLVSKLKVGDGTTITSGLSHRCIIHRRPRRPCNGRLRNPDQRRRLLRD